MHPHCFKIFCAFSILLKPFDCVRYYRKSSIKPPGIIYFKPIWGGGGGLIEAGGILEGGGLFNVETTMVSVLPKELEYKVEKVKYKKF